MNKLKFKKNDRRRKTTKSREENEPKAPAYFKGPRLISESEAEIGWKEELGKEDGTKCWSHIANGPKSLDVLRT